MTFPYFFHAGVSSRPKSWHLWVAQCCVLPHGAYRNAQKRLPKLDLLAARNPHEPMSSLVHQCSSCSSKAQPPVSSNASTQGLPPPIGACFTERMRLRCPPPQLTVQCPHSCHSFRAQSSCRILLPGPGTNPVSKASPSGNLQASLRQGLDCKAQSPSKSRCRRWHLRP